MKTDVILTESNNMLFVEPVTKTAKDHFYGGRSFSINLNPSDKFNVIVKLCEAKLTYKTIRKL